jgi:hypothetical protein
MDQNTGTNLQGLVEIISIKKLLQWAALPPTPADALDMVELGRDVDANGVKEPVLIWVNAVEGTIRLDSGNHRVYMMPLMGWTHLPCIARVTDTSIGDPANGHHFYYSGDIKLDPYLIESYFAKPSSVIRGILD